MTRSEAFTILGINSSSTPEEIKKAYRVLASKHHPDKNNGSKQSEEMMKKINEAYSILTDPSKKVDTSDFGDFGFRSNKSQNQQNDMDDIFREFFKDSYSDAFASNFYKKYRDESTQRKNEYDPIRETSSEYPKSIDIPLEDILRNTVYLDVEIYLTTTSIHYSGKTSTSRTKRTVKITPRNALEGFFEVNNSIVKINVIKDANIHLERDSGNITVDVHVNFIDAYCGTSKKLKLPNGNFIQIKIPVNSQSYTLMKLPSHGIFIYSTTFVRVIVDIIQTDDPDFLNIMNMLKDMKVYKQQNKG